MPGRKHPVRGTPERGRSLGGVNRPSFRNDVLPDGEWELDVIDTWAMTVEPMPGTHHGMARVELPARQYMAIRARRVGPGD